ncbi:hypothetical protein ACFU51_04925 [Streptomyces sp. NPDC057430]|uniref:hypothetical protein n=1 Tax=Streptomyces sp. NPDC057430 TaxID=3346131 RepID=UPI003684D5CC
MRTRTTAVAVSVGLLLTVTACGSTSESPEAATTTVLPPAATTSTPEPTTPPAPEAMAMGSTLKWDEGDISGTSAALSYKQGIKSVGSAAEETGEPDYVWAALELKVCSTKGTFSATTFPWTLAYADGARIEPSSSTWDDFPKPEFPLETKLTAGKCVRGKVVYPVPGNSRPETIVYAPDGVDPVEWTVPAK